MWSRMLKLLQWWKVACPGKRVAAVRRAGPGLGVKPIGRFRTPGSGSRGPCCRRSLATRQRRAGTSATKRVAGLEVGVELQLAHPGQAGCPGRTPRASAVGGSACIGHDSVLSESVDGGDYDAPAR